MTPDEWEVLVDQVQSGDCTPVLGPDLLPGALARDDALRRSWAGEYDFPFGDEADLPQVLQHAAVVVGDRSTVTQRLATALALSRPVDVSDPLEPHVRLAGMPISVYLTTDRFNTLSAALARQERTPVVAESAWYHGARTNPELRLSGDYRPSVDKPLVLHLYGRVTNVASLVATEQDHLALAAALVADDARGEHEVLPIQVLPALTQRRLLFVGHRYRDWSFRLLLRALLDHTTPARRPPVLVLPPPEDPALQSYADGHQIMVLWETTERFVSELAIRRS